MTPDEGELQWWRHFRTKVIDPLSEMPRVGSPLLGNGYMVKLVTASGATIKEMWEERREIDRLRSALQEIAREDYRGNIPSSVQIARRALEG